MSQEFAVLDIAASDAAWIYDTLVRTVEKEEISKSDHAELRALIVMVERHREAMESAAICIRQAVTWIRRGKLSRQMMAEQRAFERAHPGALDRTET